MCSTGCRALIKGHQLVIISIFKAAKYFCAQNIHRALDARFSCSVAIALIDFSSFCSDSNWNYPDKLDYVHYLMHYEMVYLVEKSSYLWRVVHIPALFQSWEIHKQTRNWNYLHKLISTNNTNNGNGKSTHEVQSWTSKKMRVNGKQKGMRNNWNSVGREFGVRMNGIWHRWFSILYAMMLQTQCKFACCKWNSWCKRAQPKFSSTFLYFECSFFVVVHRVHHANFIVSLNIADYIFIFMVHSFILRLKVDCDSSPYLCLRYCLCYRSDDGTKRICDKKCDDK